MESTPDSEQTKTASLWDPRERILLARAGDRAAFDELATHYRPLLLAMAFLRTGDREEAEDLVQDILVKAWASLPTLQSPAAFVPWLKAIAGNACSSWFRRRVWTEPLDDGEPEPADPGPPPLEALLAKERQRKLRRALLCLPPANRTALLLHVSGRYSYQEIAELTGVEVTTVEGRIHRARRQLRRLIPDEDDAVSARRRWKPLTPHDNEGEEK